ncbi:hypothetical protein V6N11_076660 [Hibiscus sabdariffa]|uniref:14-3-3 domain-containing protein n=1 Tax=Hibiscus sabdariffa TaxID=183260 RepID=A0ABR2A480_9ROSI
MVMEKVSASADSEELSVEERNLLSVAYKNVIDARRVSWQIVSSIEHKEERRGNEDHVAIIRDYRTKIESKISTICGGILKLLDSRLIPLTSAKYSKEATERHCHRRVGSNSPNPTRFDTQFLCVLLRDSQLSGSPLQSRKTAIAELDTLGEESYKDNTLIMQLLRNNLTLRFAG